MKMISSFFMVCLLVFIFSCSKEETFNQDKRPQPTDGKAIQRGMIYTMSNAADENRILAYSQNPNGSLQFEDSYSTHGKGSGVAMSTQGSLVVSGSRILAVNAGSNTIAAFAIAENGGLQFMDTISSDGEKPVSLTVSGNMVFVANEQSSSISGFRLNNQGQFYEIPNSKKALSEPNAGPGQIRFSPNGQLLVVTERNTNTLTFYMVAPSGVPYTPYTVTSAGETPGGFDFVGNFFVVSEAKTGMPAQSTVSSYSLWTPAAFISGPLCAGQTNASHVLANGNNVYVVNSGSNTISRFTMNNQGVLAIKETVAAATSLSPSDLVVDRAGKILFQLNSESHSIIGFKINGNHTLSKMAEYTGFPAAASGLVAF